jgi:hypothetical protein
LKIFVYKLCLWVTSVLLIYKCPEFTSHMNNDWSNNARYKVKYHEIKRLNGVLHWDMESSHNSKLHFNELNSIVNTIYTSFYFKSLCICEVNTGYLHTKQTEISLKQSEQTKIFKISYYIISEVLKNEMIKIIEVTCTLRS